MLVGSEKPGIGGELLVGQKIKPKFSVYPKGQGSDLPSWVAFDKQVNCLEMDQFYIPGYTHTRLSIPVVWTTGYMYGLTSCLIQTNSNTYLAVSLKVLYTAE